MFLQEDSRYAHRLTKWYELIIVIYLVLAVFVEWSLAVQTVSQQWVWSLLLSKIIFFSSLLSQHWSSRGWVLVRRLCHPSPWCVHLTWTSFISPHKCVRLCWLALTFTDVVQQWRTKWLRSYLYFCLKPHTWFNRLSFVQWMVKRWRDPSCAPPRGEAM